VTFFVLYRTEGETLNFSVKGVDKIMLKEQKNVYLVSMAMVVFLWFTAIIFKLANFAGNIPEIYMWVFGLIILAYISDYKTAIKGNKVIKRLEILFAVGFAASAFYILCVGFMFGRYVVGVLR